MRSNTAKRALLALILLGLLILIVRGFWNAEPTAPPQATGPEPASTPGEAAVAAQRPAAVPLPPLAREEIHFFIEGMLKPELPAEVRAWTAEQLARATVEDELVNTALRAVLDDPEPQVAAAAAAALAQRGEPGVAASPQTPDRHTSSNAGEPAPPGLRIETLD